VCAVALWTARRNGRIVSVLINTVERLLFCRKAGVDIVRKKSALSRKSGGNAVGGHLLPYNHPPSPVILRTPRMKGISRSGTAF